MIDKKPSLDGVLVKGGATTLILWILRATPTHGYDLIRTIRQRSDGIFAFSDGTIYPLLYRLRDQGLVRATREVSPEGRRRKVYHLTPEGEAELQKRLADWRLFAKGMRLALSEVE